MDERATEGAARYRMPPEPWDRTERDLQVDLKVGLRIEGYHWVEWNHPAIREAPLDEPGRFVGHPGDLLAHLYVDADESVPLAETPYVRLPRYSLEPGPALRAAERAGLFAGEGVALSCTAAGLWRVSTREVRLEDECLPRLLSRAALRLIGEPADEGDR